MKVEAALDRDSQPSAALPLLVSTEELPLRGELIQAIKAINAAELFGENSKLTFVLDRHCHGTLVRLIDRKTNQVIRQIPPEYVLSMAEELKQFP